MFTVLQTEEFVAWLDALKDKRARIRIVARLRQDAGTKSLQEQGIRRALEIAAELGEKP